VIAWLASSALAHGRDPYVVHLVFRPGAPNDVLAGTTIGLLTSHDGGATWWWTCEEAVHYRDPFDPDYAYTQGGKIFAEAFDRLGVDAGTCSFEPTSLGDLFVSSITSTTGVVYAAAADQRDSSIYKSIDDGVTFTKVASPGMPGDWWLSLEISPSDPDRVYLAGYRIRPVMTGDAMTYVKDLFLFVSTNGGTTFVPIDTSAFPTNYDSLLEIAGVGQNPDEVFVRVKYSQGKLRTPYGGDLLYRSSNGGQTWQRIYESRDPFGFAFLARTNGELVVATRISGAVHSLDHGATWQPLPDAPHISTLVEAPDGSVWAGTQNYLGAAMIPELVVPKDGYAIMKSTDLVTWTPVLQLQNLAGPACATGTDVFEKCAVNEPQGSLGTPWCCLVGALQITTTELDCTGPHSCGYQSGADGNAGDVTVHPPDGCCQGSSTMGLLDTLLVLIAFGYAYRPRRAACLRARGHR
jgi:hypothetical protein